MTTLDILQQGRQDDPRFGWRVTLQSALTSLPSLSLFSGLEIASHGNKLISSSLVNGSDCVFLLLTSTVKLMMVVLGNPPLPLLTTGLQLQYNR